MGIELDFAAVLSEWPLLLAGVGVDAGADHGVGIGRYAIGDRHRLGACARIRCNAGAGLAQSAGRSLRRADSQHAVHRAIVFHFLRLACRRFEAVGGNRVLHCDGGKPDAYAAEIIRAGLEATPKGQIEAAQSLALTPLQTFMWAVLPPALKKIWPSLVSQIVIVMLGSSVCGQISVPELSYAADLIQSNNFRSFEAFIVVGAIYLLLSIAMRHALNWAGAKFLFGRPRPWSILPIWDILRNLLLAARWTIALSFIAFIGGGLVGMLLVVLRLYKLPGLTPLVSAYVQIFQGIPLLVQLFLAYYGLGLFGINTSPWVAAGIGLTLYASAFLSEIWRGCIAAIPTGQWEASASLALNFYEQLRYVVLPQALKIAVPPTVGFLVQVIKGTALASVVGIHGVDQGRQDHCQRHLQSVPRF